MIVSSDCGYDHCIAGTKTRQTPVKFTSCLAYAEITFVIETQQILRLRGYFEHNTECKAALLFRIPRLPLHPRVHELALIALMQGVPLSNIQQSNREWFNSGGEGYVPKDAREWEASFPHPETRYTITLPPVQSTKGRESNRTTPYKPA